MNKNIATKIVNAATGLNEQIGIIDWELSQLDDVELKKKLIASLATIIGEIYVGIILPISKYYPELEPKLDTRQTEIYDNNKEVN
jgi:hypothetical protein